MSSSGGCRVLCAASRWGHDWGAKRPQPVAPPSSPRDSFLQEPFGALVFTWTEARRAALCHPPAVAACYARRAGGDMIGERSGPQPVAPPSSPRDSFLQEPFGALVFTWTKARRAALCHLPAVAACYARRAGGDMIGERSGPRPVAPPSSPRDSFLQEPFGALVFTWTKARRAALCHPPAVAACYARRAGGDMIGERSGPQPVAPPSSPRDSFLQEPFGALVFYTTSCTSMNSGVQWTG